MRTPVTLPKKLFRHVSEVGKALSGGAVAIGNFDGLHRGHQALFAAARKAGNRDNAPVGVLSFEPHPVRVLAPRLAPPLILTLEEKVEGLFQYDIDVVVIHPFDLTFAAFSPDKFVNEVLVEGLKVKTVVVGADFSFGSKGAGRIEDLQRLLHESGRDAKVVVVEAVSEGNLICSSTKVREFVLHGRMDAAQLLLGHPYWVRGLVIEGDGRGRTIDIPTANISAQRELLPKVGVYATWAVLDDDTRYPAVTNIGLRPTFEGETSADVRIETHLLDFRGDLYGQVLRVEFLARIRDEERFDSRDRLVAQIQRDIEEAKIVHQGCR